MKKYDSNRYLGDMDDTIENVSSFEEARAIINTRLNHLCADLKERSDSEDRYFDEICKALEDQKLSFMDIYAGYYAPCKVSDPVFLPKGQGDMNEVMVNFSDGFNDFITSMEEQYVSCLIRRRRATILLSKMLSIQLPYSRLMYLYYYKKMDPRDISADLYISRATFYRLKSNAINALTSLYYQPDKQSGDSRENGEKAG